MENELKKQIQRALKEKIDLLAVSQSEAARQIGVSPATITNILKGNWGNITGAWKKVQAWVITELSEWNVAQTKNLLKVHAICFHAQNIGTARAVSYHAGSGKTFAAKDYQSKFKNVFYMCCMGDMTKGQFLKKLCQVMGLSSNHRVGQMLDDIIEKLNRMNKPLLILDEFDEVSNNALRVFKDLYNRCQCGFVLMGGVHLKERIMKGVRGNKQSFREIFSRVGGEFYPLHDNDFSSVSAICTANGIFDKSKIQDIYKKSGGDLRRVEHEISAIRLNEIIQLKKSSK